MLTWPTKVGLEQVLGRNEVRKDFSHFLIGIYQWNSRKMVALVRKIGSGNLAVFFSQQSWPVVRQMSILIWFHTGHFSGKKKGDSSYKEGSFTGFFPLKPPLVKLKLDLSPLKLFFKLFQKMGPFQKMGKNG